MRRWALIIAACFFSVWLYTGVNLAEVTRLEPDRLIFDDAGGFILVGTGGMKEPKPLKPPGITNFNGVEWVQSKDNSTATPYLFVLNSKGLYLDGWFIIRKSNDVNELTTELRLPEITTEYVDEGPSQAGDWYTGAGGTYETNPATYLYIGQGDKSHFRIGNTHIQARKIMPGSDGKIKHGFTNMFLQDQGGPVVFSSDNGDPSLSVYGGLVTKEIPDMYTDTSKTKRVGIKMGKIKGYTNVTSKIPNQALESKLPIKINNTFYPFIKVYNKHSKVHSSGSAWNASKVVLANKFTNVGSATPYTILASMILTPQANLWDSAADATVTLTVAGTSVPRNVPMSSQRQYIPVSISMETGSLSGEIEYSVTVANAGLESDSLKVIAIARRDMASYFAANPNTETIEPRDLFYKKYQGAVDDTVVAGTPAQAFLEKNKLTFRTAEGGKEKESSLSIEDVSDRETSLKQGTSFGAILVDKVDALGRKDENILESPKEGDKAHDTTGYPPTNLMIKDTNSIHFHMGGYQDNSATAQNFRIENSTSYVTANINSKNEITFKGTGFNISDGAMLVGEYGVAINTDLPPMDEQVALKVDGNINLSGDDKTIDTSYSLSANMSKTGGNAVTSQTFSWPSALTLKGKGKTWNYIAFGSVPVMVNPDVPIIVHDNSKDYFNHSRINAKVEGTMTVGAASDKDIHVFDRGYKLLATEGLHTTGTLFFKVFGQVTLTSQSQALPVNIVVNISDHNHSGGPIANGTTTPSGLQNEDMTSSPVSASQTTPKMWFDPTALDPYTGDSSDDQWKARVNIIAFPAKGADL
ncbi:hypothetical protein DID75_05265 [Candidatus Marinamargulisbacteria bacterium SCGC AG-410-N11]|nr:hypothetical protein DID75_05265 [Candidatus Marinamargulisbacteria bacterium SCGC AG-410-N11]